MEGVLDEEKYYGNPTDTLSLILEKRIPTNNLNYCQNLQNTDLYSSLGED